MEAVNLISSPKYSEKQIVRTLPLDRLPPITFLYIRELSSQHTITRGTRLTCATFCIQGVPGGDVVDARELRSAQIGRQLDSEGLG